MKDNEMERDEALVSRALKQLAEEAPRHRALPEARYLWLTAQLIPSRAEQERALKPMGILQVIAHVIVALCWAFVITWKWSTIKSWFSGPDLVSRALDAMVGAASVPLSSLVIVGGLLCVTTVVIVHSVLAEE